MARSEFTLRPRLARTGVAGHENFGVRSVGLGQLRLALGIRIGRRLRFAQAQALYAARVRLEHFELETGLVRYDLAAFGNPAATPATRTALAAALPTTRRRRERSGSLARAAHGFLRNRSVEVNRESSIKAPFGFGQDCMPV